MTALNTTSTRMLKELLKELLYDAWCKHDLEVSESIIEKSNKAISMLDEMCYLDGADMCKDFLIIMDEPLDLLINKMNQRLKERKSEYHKNIRRR